MSFNFDRRTFLKGAGAVGAASLLAACGEKSNNTGNGVAASGAAAPNSTGATPLKEFISFESGNRELESWNMLYTQKAEDANVVTNLWDGLLSFDRYGKVVPAIASSWEHNEDATVWTFHLRDDVDWVDCNGEVKAHLTSKDFLVGFEWVMNAIKNEANNTSMPNDTIVGAYEYYELTKEAGDAAADMTYEDMLAAGVGIEAPDDYTLVFTCPSACPYFDTVAAYNSFYPAAEDLINELGIEGFRACDYTNMWYNGPYVVEEFISQNTKSYIPNPNYFGANDVSRFDRFTVTMISDGTVTFQLYQNRELDEMDLNESTITTITMMNMSMLRLSTKLWPSVWKNVSGSSPATSAVATAATMITRIESSLHAKPTTMITIPMSFRYSTTSPPYPLFFVEQPRNKRQYLTESSPATGFSTDYLRGTGLPRDAARNLYEQPLSWSGDSSKLGARPYRKLD